MRDVEENYAVKKRVSWGSRDFKVGGVGRWKSLGRVGGEIK